MAQTTGGTSGVAAKVEVSANGSSWTDISGSTSVLDPGEQAGATGDAYTFSGDTAIVTAGKTEPLEITVQGVYTETAGEGFEVVRAQFQTSARVLYVRWSPKGGTTGQFLHTAAAGVISGLTWPKVDTGDGKPVPWAFKVRTPSITKSTL